MMKQKKWAPRIAACALIAGLLVIGSLWVLRRQGRADLAPGRVDHSIMVESMSFVNGTTMPRKFTCDGASLSPEMHWSRLPPDTRSLVLLMEDRDAPFGFVHWLVYGIPGGERDLAEGAASQGSLPPGAEQGINSADTVAYAGPCPPGKSAHHYRFQLYALNVALRLPRGQTKQQLAAAVKGHVLADGQSIGLYTREAH